MKNSLWLGKNPILVPNIWGIINVDTHAADTDNYTNIDPKYYLRCLYEREHQGQIGVDEDEDDEDDDAHDEDEDDEDDDDDMTMTI